MKLEMMDAALAELANNLARLASTLAAAQLRLLAGIDHLGGADEMRRRPN